MLQWKNTKGTYDLIPEFQLQYMHTPSQGHMSVFANQLTFTAWLQHSIVTWHDLRPFLQQKMPIGMHWLSSRSQRLLNSCHFCFSATVFIFTTAAKKGNQNGPWMPQLMTIIIYNRNSGFHCGCKSRTTCVKWIAQEGIYTGKQPFLANVLKVHSFYPLQGIHFAPELSNPDWFFLKSERTLNCTFFSPAPV